MVGSLFLPTQLYRRTGATRTLAQKSHVNEVTHAKRLVDVADGVAERQDFDDGADRSWMARSKRIYTSGVTASGTGAAAD